MTTLGEDIAKAIRDVSRETNTTLHRGIDVIEEAGKAIGYLALSTDNLARQLKQHTPREPEEDGEPVRRPFSAWPKMNRPVTAKVGP